MNSSAAEDASVLRKTSWFLYLIECLDGSIYTGIAIDVAARYIEHASGKGARYTRAHPPSLTTADQDTYRAIHQPPGNGVASRAPPHYHGPAATRDNSRSTTFGYLSAQRRIRKTPGVAR